MLYEGRSDIFLVNPIIDKISKIPYSPIFRAPRSKLNVSYLPITKEVKVFCHRTVIVIGEKNKFLWSVFTVGRDTYWRTCDVNHNFEIDLSFQDWIESFSMGGLIFHWFLSKGSFYCKKKFVVIDVADESFHVVDTPADPFLHLIPMEKQLFLISMRRQLPPADEEDGIRIWKMRDFRRSEWEEVLRIEEVDDELRSVLIEKFRFGLAWLEDHKILVFLSSQWKMMVYDFKSKECYYIPQPPNYYNIHPDLFHHTTSLVSW